MNLLKQISIYLPNKPGALAKFLTTLRENSIRVHAISVNDTVDFGLILLIVDKSDKCITLVENQNLSVNSSDVIAVLLPADPSSEDSVLKISKILGENNINIQYLYTTQVKRNLVLIIRPNDAKRAYDVLKSKGMYILEAKDL